jgi:branched-chain amino acid transport system substrate-binding protein
MKRTPIALVTAAVLLALSIAACSSGGSSSSSSTNNTTNNNSTNSATPASSNPIVVGADLSLSGDFATEGVPYARGYDLWASYVNSHGGLLGRQVSMKILSDASNQPEVTTNYQALISIDHVSLLFGPVSTLFTVPAAREALRFGYALVEGAGGGPLVFNSGLTNVFDTGLPVAGTVVPFARYLASLPPSIRPKTAAYATENDPFDQPETQGAQQVLQAAGIKTVYSKVFPQEVADYAPIADQIAATKAQVVILGAGDLSVLSPFVHAFIQQGYNPEAFYTANGANPPQFAPAIGGTKNAEGIVTSGSWFPGYDNSDSQAFVKLYLQTYGGTADNIDPSVAEGYSVGEVMAAAVEATHSLNQQTIMNYLHSGAVIQTVLGPVSFNKLGENTKASAFLFQWQNGQYVAADPPQSGVQGLIFPKPGWGA